MEYFLSLVPLALFQLFVMYRNPELVKPVAVASVFFVVYGMVLDYIAIQRGWWSYGNAFLLGPKFLGIPLEDFLFMIIIPGAIIAAFHVVKPRKI